MGSSTITIKVNGQWDGKALQSAVRDIESFGKSITNNTKLWQSQGQKLATQTAAWSTSVTSSLARASTDLVKSGQEIYAFGEQLESIGSKLTTSVTVPMVAVGTYAGAMAVQFDTAMADVRKVTDMTESQLDALADSALELSTTQPVTAAQILTIEALGAQLGVADDKLEEFSMTVNGLDIATNMNAEQAASEMQRFANIVGMADTEYENFGSTIVALGNNLATTESEISTMAMRLAAAGDIAGMSEPEIMGMAGAMSSLGIRAEAGGSAMTTIMSNISKAAATGGDALEAFASVAGMSADEFAAAWESDPMDALQALLQGIHDLDESGQDMNVTLSELGINEIRQSDAMRRLANNTGILTDAVDLATTAWEENTALQNEVDQRNESMASRLQVLKNRIDEIAINVGGPLVEALIGAIDALDPVITGVSDVARAFSEMDEDGQRAVLALAAVAAGAGPVTSALGGVSKVVGNFISEVGRAGQGAAVFRDALETMDVAAIRNYSSAGTLEAKMGLLGNTFVQAAGGAENVVKVYDDLDIVTTKYKKNTDALSGIMAKYGGSLEGASDKAKVHVAQLRSQRDELVKQKSALEGTISGWKQSASEMDNANKRATAFRNTVKGVNPDTMKAAESVGDLGSKARIAGDGLAVAGTKAAQFVVSFAKMAGVAALIGAATAAVAALVAEFAEAAEHERLLNEATETFADVSANAAMGAESQAESIAGVTERTEELLRSLADLNSRAGETMGEFETSSATLDDYMGTIDRLTGKYSLTAYEQEQLKAAVAGYNDITGQSVEVTNAATGELSVSTEELHKNADAWRANAEAQALQQLSVEYTKQQIKAQQELSQAQKELNQAEAEYNDLIQSYVDSGYSEAMAEHLALNSDVGESYKQAKQNVDELAKAEQSAADSVEDINYQLAALNEAVVPYTDALKGFGDALLEAFAGSGASVEEFAVKLQEAQVPLDTLTQVGAEKLGILAESCDGDVDAMVGALQRYGAELTTTQAKNAASAEAIRQQLANLSDTGGMDLDELSAKLAAAGVSTEDLNRIGSAQLSALAASCNGNIDQMVSDISRYNDKDLEDKDADVNAHGNVIDGSAERATEDTNDAIVKLNGRTVTVNANGNYGSAASGIWNLVNAINNLSGKTVNVIANTIAGAFGNAAGGFALHADGGYRLHAPGGIATRAVPLDIVGEAGAEAIVPLTNRKYAMPFVSLIASETAARLNAPSGGDTYVLNIDGSSLRMGPRAMELVGALFDELDTTLKMGVR